jgi:hypothetical protein
VYIAILWKTLIKSEYANKIPLHISWVAGVFDQSERDTYGVKSILAKLTHLIKI